MRVALALTLGLALASLSSAKLYSISPTPQLPASELPLVPAPAPLSVPEDVAAGENAVLEGETTSASMEKPVMEIHHLPTKTPVSIHHVKANPVPIAPSNTPSQSPAQSPGDPNALAPAAVGEDASAPNVDGKEDEPTSAGCPYTKAEMTDWAGASYYHEGPASDNSLGCWTTDFAWGALLYVSAMWLKSQSRDTNGLTLLWRPGYEHTRWLLTWGLLSLGLAELFAGWYHAVFTNLKVHREDAVWFTCLICLASHASCYSCACIAMHKEGDNTWVNVIGYLIAGFSGWILFICAFVFEWDFPVAFSVMSLVPLVAVTFSICLHGIKYKTYKDTVPVLVGCAIQLFGLAVQWTNSPDCASPCPVGCPFPVPNFNHNAAFHFLGILSVYPTIVGFAGICHELEAPDGMPYFGLYARDRFLKPNYKRPHARHDQTHGRFAQHPDHEGNYRDDCMPTIVPPEAVEALKQSWHGPPEETHDYVHRHDHGPRYQ